MQRYIGIVRYGLVYLQTNLKWRIVYVKSKSRYLPKIFNGVLIHKNYFIKSNVIFEHDLENDKYIFELGFQNSNWYILYINSFEDLKQYIKYDDLEICDFQGGSNNISILSYIYYSNEFIHGWNDSFSLILSMDQFKIEICINGV